MPGQGPLRGTCQAIEPLGLGLLLVGTIHLMKIDTLQGVRKKEIAKLLMCDFYHSTFVEQINNLLDT